MNFDVQDKPWHKDCFVCVQCKRALSDAGNFYEFEGSFYCEPHYHVRVCV